MKRRLVVALPSRALASLVTLVVGTVIVGAVDGPLEREAGACSCRGPEIGLLGLDQVDDAPQNAKVRIEVPSPAVTGATAATAARTVLRTHGGSEVPSTSRTIAPGGWLSVIEITPGASLPPSTRYEIAIIDATKIPATTVIGTFRTGSGADTNAPRIDAMGVAVAFNNPNAQGPACQVSGPWVIIDGVQAQDPGRPEAQLVFGIWLADGAGNIEPKKPPTALVKSREGKLLIGRSSLCDPHDFPMPKTPSMTLGIAAIDESGNASALRRVRVDLAAARPN